MPTLFRNATIRLPDLARASDWIADCTFEGCVIEGPAMVTFRDAVTWTGNNVFHVSSIDALLIDVAPGREVVGVIVLQRCVFHSCRFRRIGVLINPIERARWQRGFAPEPNEPEWFRYVNQPETPSEHDTP